MKKKVIISVLVGLLLISVIAIFNNKENEEEVVNEETEIVLEEIQIDTSEYHKELERIYKDNNVLGMSVVSFKDGKIIDSYNIGYTDILKQEEIDDNTVYRIASLSKMISNILVMQLVDQGKITLNSNLKEVTGLDFSEDIRLKHILTHTSGLIDPYFFNDTLNEVFDINYLLKYAKSENKAGENYHYSNFASGTISAVIECLTNQRFYEFAKESLFDPLNLNMAYLTELLKEDTTVCKMYTNEEIDPKTWKYNKEFYDQFEIGKQYRLSYGNLYASTSDLAVLGSVLAGDGTYNGQRVLSEKALMLIRKKWDDAKDQLYSMGLNTDIFEGYVDGRIIYGHTGAAYNAYSCLMYDPSDKTGVVVLTNNAINVKNDLGYNTFLYDSVNASYKYLFDNVK